MDEDVLYPVSTEKLIQKSDSRVKKETAEKHAYIKERPILQSILDYFDNQIESYKSVESVRTDNMDDFRFDTEVNKRMIRALERERKTIDRLEKMYGADKDN